jgi:hypothetical protein
MHETGELVPKLLCRRHLWAAIEERPIDTIENLSKGIMGFEIHFSGPDPDNELTCPWNSPKEG